jgi:branched-chain amino acid transport system substrate-binding protein
VPQLFVATGATKFGDPKNFPWTMGWQPTYQTEGRIYAKYILEKLPQGKIGILYQNDDSGRDYLKGLKDGLGAEATKRMIVGEIPYEPTDPTVDRQIITLKTLGADIFFNEASPKFAAQAIRKSAEIGWKPVQFLASISNSVGSVLKPAGLDNAKGVLSTNYLKDPTDPTWRDDPAIREWAAFMDKYFPEGDKTSTFSVYGYLTAQTMVQVLKQCGDELTAKLFVSIFEVYDQPITRARRNSLIVSDDKPISPKTASVCCPSIGGGNPAWRSAPSIRTG